MNMNTYSALRRSMYLCLTIAVVAMLSTVNATAVVTSTTNGHTSAHHTVAPPAGVIFDDGPTDGNDNAFFITGPNNANFLGSFQDISNGFTATGSGAAASLTFGEWIESGFVPNSVSYEIGTSAFGTDIGSGTVALSGSNLALLGTNAFGYDVYQVTIPVTSSVMSAGGAYWLSLSNANDASTSGTEAWDITNGGSGGPAVCNFRQSGTNFGDCGLGGESWTLSSGNSSTPEPGTIMLFGSGIVGLAGLLRRKIGY